MLRAILTFLLAPIFCINVFSQDHYYPNTVYPDSTLSFGTCPFDSTKQIWKYDGFTVYQTQNNMPNGPIDSNYCINMGKDGDRHYAIDGWNSAPGRPIFIKWKPTATIKGRSFESHSLIELNTAIISKRESHFNDSSDCAFGDCLGVSSSIRKQVSLDSQLLSEIESDLDYLSSNQNGTYAYFTSKCHPSEKYDSIAFDSLMISVQLEATDSFRISHSLSSFGTEAYLIDTSELEGARIDSVSYQFGNSIGSNYVFNYLFGHYLPGTPSNSNIAFFDFVPSPNTDSAIGINVEFMNYVALITESFVQFRGGLPKLDTNRHTLNVINNGADHCMYWFGERVFAKNTNLIHKKVGIYPDAGACTMFNSGSNLIIDTDSKLFYGYEGKGMLAVKPESRIKLRPGSLLSLSTMLVLLDDVQSDQHRYRIEIPKGAKLEFRENSKISTQYCSNSDTKVEIIMMGGEIDLSGLDEDSRQKVIVRFPSSTNAQTAALRLVNNPVQDDLIIFVEAQSESEVALLVYAMDGTLIHQSTQYLASGNNKLHVDCRHLLPGAYIIKAKNQALASGLKMIKL